MARRIRLGGKKRGQGQRPQPLGLTALPQMLGMMGQFIDRGASAGRTYPTQPSGGGGGGQQKDKKDKDKKPQESTGSARHRQELTNLGKLINVAAPVILQGGGQDEKEFRAAHRLARMPGAPAVAGNFDLGPGWVEREYEGRAVPMRRVVRDQVTTQLEYLQNAGMPKKEAMASLKQFYKQANQDRKLEYGRGAAPRRFKNKEVVGAVMQAPPPQQIVDQQNQQLQQQVINPFIEQLQAQQLNFANWYENEMMDRASRLRNPEDALVASQAVSDYANLMRWEATNLPAQMMSPYGGKDSIGYLLGRGQQGMGTMLSQLGGTNISTADPFGGQGMDFASQVLGMGPMEEQAPDAGPGGGYFTTPQTSPTAYYGGNVGVNDLMQQQPGYYGPFTSGYFQQP